MAKAESNRTAKERTPLTVGHVAQELERFAPLRLAESWDNVGLLIGDRKAEVARVMTCLTVTPASVAEAINAGVSLIVTHHPLPFRPVQRITTDSTVGRLLWELIGAKISVFSPHTAFDSAAGGINRQLAEGLNLQEIQPLVPREAEPAMLALDDAGAGEGAGIGAGRNGRLLAPISLDALALQVKTLLGIERMQVVGASDAVISRVAVACGSGGDFVNAARRRGCQCLITGEANFHAALEAEATGVGLLLTGHFASERFAVERLAEFLQQTFAQLEVWASRDERDPHRVV